MHPQPEPPDEDDPSLDDLVVPLLHAALQARYAADKLRTLAERNPDAAPPARRQVSQAITTISSVQHILIRTADQIRHGGPTQT
jgi:hypothetical protein